MRVLLLTKSFNSLAQRLYVDLARDGHELSVEFDIADAVTEEACELFRPDVIVAPFLKRKIPDAVWQRIPCLIVHPGPPGDRGPSSLDWAVLEGVAEWGVTVLRATGDYDAGPVYAHESFAMREARKGSLYRFEVTEAASLAVRAALQRVARGGNPAACTPHGGSRGWRPLMPEETRTVDWERDDAPTVLRKIASADGAPGALATIAGRRVRLFDAHPCIARVEGRPGSVAAVANGALLVRASDRAVWIGHVRPLEGDQPFKLPAAVALASEIECVTVRMDEGYDEIRYEEADGVGWLHFDFYNGAMGTNHCLRLLEAFREATARPTRAIVLAGGTDFWSNGIHLNLIEAARSPADESWRNINAMDDLAHALVTTTSHFTIAALRGNAGAGGAFLALAADAVWARDGVLLNPHYKNMGNLYGSEFWTYLLPRRVGGAGARALMGSRLPIAAREATACGLADACIEGPPERFFEAVHRLASGELRAARLRERLAAKRETRLRDEAAKSLDRYREEELARMHRNFYGFDPSYHYARSHFVHKVPHAWTPRHLARHREAASCFGRSVSNGTDWS
jgi:putative two-component system hydrogenase maturation factor HypX/HoxX